MQAVRYQIIPSSPIIAELRGTYLTDSAEMNI